MTRTVMKLGRLMARTARDGKRAGEGWSGSGIWWCARGRWWRGADLPSRGRWYICRRGISRSARVWAPAELYARCSSMTSRQKFARPCIRCMIPIAKGSLHGTHRPGFQKADQPPISGRPAGPVPALRCMPSPNATFLDPAHLDPCSSALWLPPSHAQPQIRPPRARELLPAELRARGAAHPPAGAPAAVVRHAAADHDNDRVSGSK